MLPWHPPLETEAGTCSPNCEEGTARYSPESLDLSLGGEKWTSYLSAAGKGSGTNLVLPPELGSNPLAANSAVSF